MTSDADEPVSETRPQSQSEFEELARHTAGPGKLIVERYRLLELLGSGGTGRVWRARDQVTETDVALKLLLPSGRKQDDQWARVQREFRIVRRLRHPGVVRIHDVGVWEEQLYLVMELLQGEPLSARLRRHGALTPDEAVHVLDGILDALRETHAAGVIHRDLKPANIFLASPMAGESHERVVILDFGLARASQDVTLTTTDRFQGTPAYVSPEQATGARVDAATDLYSAGVVFWELLAGRRLFDANSMAEVLAAHIRQPAPSVRRFRRGVPRWQARLADWLLEKRPDDRPADAGVALRCLRARGRRMVPLRTLVGWRRNSVRALTLVGGAALAIGLGTVLLLPWQVEREGASVKLASLAGLTLRSISLPREVVDGPQRLEPGGLLDYRYVVLLGRGDLRTRGFPAEFSSGIVEIDFWRGTRNAIPMGVSGRLLKHRYASYDSDYYGHSLQATPWTTGAGAPLMLAIYDHKSFLTKIVAFDDSGGVYLNIDHPGRITGVPLFSESGPTTAAMFLGVNQFLGNRAVLWRLSPERFRLRNSISIPPHETSDPDWLSPDYYTFLPVSAAVGLQLEGEHAVVRPEEGESLRFDLATGAPVETTQRDGLTTDSWLTGQVALHDLLRKTSYGATHTCGEMAADLESLVGRVPLDRVQSGVALARAAVLWRRGGEFERGLVAVRRALELEPAIAGHHRLFIDLMTRTGRWDELLEERLQGGELEYTQDLVFAALVVNRPETLPGARRDILDTSYGVLRSALVELHAGRPGKTLEITGDVERYRDRSHIAFVDALALSLLVEFDAEAAMQRLATAKRGRGAGLALPFAALQNFVEIRAGRLVSPDDALRLELEEHAMLARESIGNEYFRFWGEALAACVEGGQESLEAWLSSDPTGQRVRPMPWATVLSQTCEANTS